METFFLFFPPLKQNASFVMRALRNTKPPKNSKALHIRILYNISHICFGFRLESVVDPTEPVHDRTDWSAIP